MGSSSGPVDYRSAVGIFGIGKEDGQRIITRLGHTFFDENEKIFGSYW
jgi:hypothetical protein